MNAKLKKISEWTARGIKIGMRGYQYAPINSKNHFARGRDEFVIWCEREEGDFTQGILWARGEECAFIPFPEAEKGWNNPVLIDSDSDVLVIDGNGEKVWSISSPKNAPCEVKCENWCLETALQRFLQVGKMGVIRLFVAWMERSMQQTALPFLIIMLRHARCSGNRSSITFFQTKK